ncbi:hypothetical protein PHYSODRAFT_311575 [Phytophthora sojae]|uniref:Uncharacterized protein n=1 Tax=Phytophthora sojae (strain P6497) TaxID=1094619 RepID=G4Z1B5_PHYSP|nr:hypothetical protein PHYSODRAFT_311575 [Phytophthora sojae]EGZ24734.1 hypothetical protein PHYSODRAFT_311575 [Phytophthora sojae]|eukprot:XP_009520022.1 hypothetical protein PHYSODRAFT_311575 [Phytophthora sojae]
MGRPSRSAQAEAKSVGSWSRSACLRTRTTPSNASPYLVVDNIGRLRVDSVSDSDAHDDVAYGELAQPRPEIILRWKRFAVLVGFVVNKNVPVDKADMVNSYIGLIMGFVESFVGLGVEEIFSVFIVYLHNLRWYPGDDPATKRQSKFKKFSLTIFIPAVMMAVISSINNSSTNATATRFLMQEVTELGWTGLADSILKTALERRVDPMLPLDTSRCTAEESELLSAQSLLAAAPKAAFEEVTKRYEVAYPGAGNADRDVQLSEVMPLTTAYELWTQGKSVLLKSVRATSSGQVSTAPSTTGELLGRGASLDASFERMALSSLTDMDVMTLKVPLRAPTNSSVVCGEMTCALLEPVRSCLLYGLTAETTGVSDDQGEIERSLVLSFCDTGASCQVLHHQLEDGDRYLVVPKQLLPAMVDTMAALADTNSRQLKVFRANTKVGNICTWTRCAVLLLLTVLTLVLPNERARLSPPRGAMPAPKKQIYPNLIYKKRFLIGKTGEEIKFGEFAVESVGLYHKMEEGKQIYI